ncbi:MAG TPA: response regulator [Patescibacteria group bacterium]|jgi:CheY-like chemotaxis protein|nr:response regulator [Patescibacteria group bacterium]
MKILIIDDDAVFRGAMSKALKKEKYETFIALDGMEATGIIKAENPDLIITDLFMPNKEGFELIQEVRETDPSIKIIAISSDGLAGRSSFLKMAKAFGANAVLQKPFTAEDLLATIEELQGK